MGILRAPGLGPLIGHTTDTTCRIWIRAADPADDKAALDEDRRTVGVLGLVKGNRIDGAWYFRLNREYDRTGTFVLGSDVQLGYYPNDFDDQGKDTPDELSKGLKAALLEPDTEYRVRVATLTVDDPNPNAARIPDWELVKRLPKIDEIKGELMNLDPDVSEATFRTFPPADRVLPIMSFLVGSCRYPGLLWKIKEADRIFGPMQVHFEEGNRFGARARFTMMCGDQIYADMLNRHVPLLRADTYAEFQDRYVAAFGAPNLRKLLRQSSTYMILDDHEIEDNWIQDRLTTSASERQLFSYAISAYMNYQWSHGPRSWGRQLYYQFVCGGYPFFVLDTRTQRLKNNVDQEADDGLKDNHLLGSPNIDPLHPGQLKRLLAWLSEQQRTRGDVPKFIVTSSVFVPNPMDERISDTHDTPLDQQLFGVNRVKRDASDSWPAFPQTRRSLLEHIVSEQVQNVVFLAGDIHCSNVATLEFEKDAGTGVQALPLKACAITSSAFYWPFPFADGDPNGYVHDSRDAQQWDPFPLFDGTTRMHYRSFGYTQDDNFVRVDLDRAASTLAVRTFARDGKVLQVGDPNGAEVDHNLLQLAPWA